jgi:hypothetical protein
MSAQAPEPGLNPAIVVDDTLLTAVVDGFIRANFGDRAHRDTIVVLQEHLREHVGDDVWLVYLKLDETVTARLADLSLAVARWAYLEGLRYGGGQAQGGGK